MWQVNVDELHFDDPVEVIGQGSFGVVLLAEYRGTKVAIKRALRSGDKKGSTHGRSRRNRKSSSVTSGSHDNVTASVEVISNQDTNESGSVDVESADHSRDSGNNYDSRGSLGMAGRSRKSSDGFTLGFLAEDFGGRHKRSWLNPWAKHDDYHSRFKDTILGGSTASASGTGLSRKLFPWCNEQARRQEEFMSEMRVLSRLRHPCITTVMGAVISNSHDPMLVMEYMEYGSLHDLLRNETMYLSGEIIMQIARDIASGLRFLHSSSPPIVHGDLKAR
jgi:serine/threonine protein kinase